MLYVALAELGLLALVIYGAWSVIRYQQRAFDRREDLLLNKTLHAVGKPWQRAPADERPSLEALLHEREELLAPRVFTQTPEQEP